MSPVTRPIAQAVGLALVTIGLVALNSYALPIYPAPSCDDVSYSSTITSFLSRGHFGWSPVFTQGDFAGRDVNWLPQGRLFSAGFTGWFVVFGDSRVSARFYSLAGGIVAALLLYSIGTRLYNRRTGIIAALLFATSALFFVASHLARPDMWLSAFSLLVLIAVHKSLSTSALRWTFVAGLLAAAAVDIHGNGLCVVAAASTIQLWVNGWRERHLPKVAAFMAGLAVGMASWIVVHLWPSPASAWAQIREVLARTSMSGGAHGAVTFVSNPLTIGQYLVEVYGWRGKPWSIGETVLVVIGLLTASIRRNASDKLLVSWVTVSFATFAVLFSQRFVTYSMLFSPVLILLGVAALEPMAARATMAFRRHDSTPMAAAATAALILSANVMGNVWVTYRHADNNFYSMSQTLDAMVPRGARVLADPNWWWALRENRTFITDEYLLTPLPPFDRPSATVLAGIENLNPDYVLLDAATSCYDAGGPGHVDLVKYVNAHCTGVAELQGAWTDDPSRSTTLLGQTTRVYRCAQP